MSQYVNLFPQLGVGQRDWLTGHKLLQWCAVAAVLALVLAVSDLYRYSVHQERADREAARLAQAESLLAQIVAERQALGSSNEMLQSITSLESLAENKRSLLARIGGETDGDDHGVVRYLVGLGNQPPKGLWFTRIEVHGDGTSMALAGRTRTAEAVPGYLRRLRAEPAFNGQRFSMMQLAAVEGSNLLDFSIRSNREAE